MWSRFDDGYYMHPKVVAAGNEAVGVHARSVAYCTHHLTDGVLPKAAAMMLCGIDRYPDVSRALIRVGLWEEDGLETYRIHDYLTYNFPAKYVRKQQKKAKARMRRVRANSPRRSPELRSTPSTGWDEYSSESVSSLLPDSGKGSGAVRVPALRGAFDRFWAAYPRKVGKGAARAAWEKHRPVLDAVLDALAWQSRQTQWLRDGGQFIPNPATWLSQRRWEDEPSELPSLAADEIESARAAAAFVRGESSS